MKYSNGVGSPVHSLDLSNRRDESERMYSQILGERIDIALASELNLEHRPTLHGFASAGVHTLVAESLPNRYVDARPGVVVMDADLRTIEAATAVALFDAIALHEVAHLIQMAITAEVCSRFHGREHRAMAVAPAEVESVKWLTHDVRFIRALLHLNHRVKSRGAWVSLPLAFPHESYALSPIGEYAVALGDEPARSDWKPLNEVLATQMPDELVKLWGRDVAASLGLKCSEKGKK